MIVTTTTGIEGFEISSYEGIVFGEVISGINLIKDMGLGCAICLVDVLRDTRMNC